MYIYLQGVSKKRLFKAFLRPPDNFYSFIRLILTGQPPLELHSPEAAGQFVVALIAAEGFLSMNHGEKPFSCMML